MYLVIDPKTNLIKANLNTAIEAFNYILERNTSWQIVDSSIDKVAI